jgi:hypothetical protein
MRHRHRKNILRLIRDKRTNAPEPISTLSPDEQARLLGLADVALSNPKPDEPRPAGTRAKQAHKRLEQELEDALDKFERDKDKAA